MNNDDSITIDLNEIDPVEFSWDDSTGLIAQEITAFPGTTVTLNSGISITSTGIAASAMGSSYTISTPYDDLADRLSRLEQLIAEEEEVRRTHPAVKMAYDEYRLLYILAKKNPGDHLTE